MPVAPNYPRINYYDAFYNPNGRTYPTKIVLPLVAFNTIDEVLFTVKASVNINSKVLNFKSGDTYEFLNYKRTINTNGKPDSIDYSLSNFSLMGLIAPNGDAMSSSRVSLFSKYYFDLFNNRYVMEECEARLEVINLQNVVDNPISGFDLNSITDKEYLLYLAIEIPFVGNTLDCSIEVHDFITDLASYQKITPFTIYPYNPIGWDEAGVNYIPDTGDNELFVGAT